MLYQGTASIFSEDKEIERVEVKVKRKIIELLISIATVGYFATATILAIQKQNQAPYIKPSQFHEWVKGNSPLIIDLREPREIEQNPLNYHRFVNIPFLYLEERLDEVNFPQDRALIFVCSDGNRARLIATLLAERGVHSYYLRYGLNFVRRVSHPPEPDL